MEGKFLRNTPTHTEAKETLKKLIYEEKFSGGLQHEFEVYSRRSTFISLSTHIMSRRGKRIGGPGLKLTLHKALSS